MGNTGWCRWGKRAAELGQNHQSFVLAMSPLSPGRRDRLEVEPKRKILQSGAASRMGSAQALGTCPELCALHLQLFECGQALEAPLWACFLVCRMREERPPSQAAKMR